MMHGNRPQSKADTWEPMSRQDSNKQALAHHFLSRLKHLATLDETYGNALEPEIARALRRAIFSTYLDLRELGEGELALELLCQMPRPLREVSLHRPSS